MPSSTPFTSSMQVHKSPNNSEFPRLLFQPMRFGLTIGTNIKPDNRRAG